MVTRQHIFYLLTGMAVLVTVLAVLGAFQGLAVANDDPGGQLALRWAAAAVSTLAAVNVILLVAALGMRELQRGQSPVEATHEHQVEESIEPDVEIDLERERRLGG